MKDKPLSAFPEWFLLYKGPFNLTLDQFNISMYYPSEGYGWKEVVYFYNDFTCVPQDENT